MRFALVKTPVTLATALVPIIAVTDAPVPPGLLANEILGAEVYPVPGLIILTDETVLPAVTVKVPVAPEPPPPVIIKSNVPVIIKSNV